jgi:hypothetical protein
MARSAEALRNSAARFSRKAAMPSFRSALGKHGMEHAALEPDAFGQRRFVGAVDAFLGHHDNGQGLS